MQLAAMIRRGVTMLAVAVVAFAAGVRAEVNEVRLASQYGLAYLPLFVMQHGRLIEKHAKAAGLGDMKATWTQFAGANVMNDALLSGNLEFISVGPAPLALLWARTKDTPNFVKGVAAYCSFPLYLNTRNPAVKSIRDFTDKDRIALPAVKVSGQALALQMAAAKEWGEANYGRLDHLTVSQSHGDASAQLLSGKGPITAHFTAAPFHQQQMKDPAIRTVLKSYDVVGGRATAILLATTSRFREANPKTYAAVLAALREAIDTINKDRRAAAELYVKATNEKRNSIDDLVKMMEDPDFVYTLTPERTLAYAQFQQKVGRVKVAPSDWKEMYFPEIHALPGS